MQVETNIILDFCSLHFGIFAIRMLTKITQSVNISWKGSEQHLHGEEPHCGPTNTQDAVTGVLTKTIWQKLSPKIFCKSLCQKMSLCQEMSCLGKTARAEAISVIGRMMLQVNFRKTCWGSCHDSCCGSHRDFRCGLCSTITSQCHLMGETGAHQKVSSFVKNIFSKFRIPTHDLHTFLLSSLSSIKLELEPNIWSLPF